MSRGKLALVFITSRNEFLGISTKVIFCRWFDYLEITNEYNENFGVYCGVVSGRSVLVTGTFAVLTFYSDFEIQARGFHILFAPVPLSK